MGWCTVKTQQLLLVVALVLSLESLPRYGARESPPVSPQVSASRRPPCPERLGRICGSFIRWPLRVGARQMSRWRDPSLPGPRRLIWSESVFPRQDHRGGWGGLSFLPSTAQVFPRAELRRCWSGGMYEHPPSWALGILQNPEAHGFLQHKLGVFRLGLKGPWAPTPFLQLSFSFLLGWQDLSLLDEAGTPL